MPKLVTVLREGYSWKKFGNDLVAGVIVGIVALPLAIAFGIASGVNPERGLATAVVAGFLISALGGSRVQIGGPTGAFVVIVYGVVEKFGYHGLAVATMMAGVMLVLLGIARLGTVIKFVPYPVTVGFTSGIAVLIATSQVPDFLGLRLAKVPSDFAGKIAVVARHAADVDLVAVALGIATCGLIVVSPKLTRRVPGSLIAILLTTAVVHLGGLPVETIGDRFGSVPTSLPMPSLPSFDLELLRELFPSAIAIAALAAIESLLSAVVADGMLGTRHRSNTELIAQGIANIASPLFGGIPATGAIARTATNVKNGGRTPVAGMVHAATLLAILWFFGKWATLIPLATLAGVLLVVAVHMSEWRVFLRLFRSPRHDVCVLLATFGLTVWVDLVVAIEVGMVLAAFLFMHRMAQLSQASLLRDLEFDAEDEDELSSPRSLARRVVPPGVEVFDIQGALFFGAASKFESAILQVERSPQVLILRLRQVLAVDATGVRALEDVVAKSTRKGTTVVLCGVASEVRSTLERVGLLARISPDNVVRDIDAALARAHTLMEDSPHETAASA